MSTPPCLDDPDGMLVVLNRSTDRGESLRCANGVDQVGCYFDTSRFGERLFSSSKQAVLYYAL